MFIYIYNDMRLHREYGFEDMDIEILVYGGYFHNTKLGIDPYKILNDFRRQYETRSTILTLV